MPVLILPLWHQLSFCSVIWPLQGALTKELSTKHFHHELTVNKLSPLKQIRSAVKGDLLTVLYWNETALNPMLCLSLGEAASARQCMWNRQPGHHLAGWLRCPGRFRSGQFRCSVVSDFLQHHGLQHARLPCPSPTPGACSTSWPSHLWCHTTISSSIIPFSSHLQSFPASESFQVSQFFASGGQSIGASDSVLVLTMNIQYWVPFRLTGLMCLQSKGLSRVFSNTTVQEHQFFSAQLSLQFNSHIHTWLLEKP